MLVFRLFKRPYRRIWACVYAGLALGAYSQSRRSTGSGYWAEDWDRDMGLHIEDSILSADHTANGASPNIGSLASQLMTVYSRTRTMHSAAQPCTALYRPSQSLHSTIVEHVENPV